MKPLPPHLLTALQAIIDGSGDDIRFVLGYLNEKTASGYVSKLKSRGLAYTYRANGTTEVWPHPKGIAVAARAATKPPKAPEGHPRLKNATKGHP